MSSSKRGIRRDRTPLEISVLAAAIVAIAGLVAGLIVSGFGGGPDRPELRATVRSIGAASGGDAYLIRVRNDGKRTAEHVLVEVTIGSEKRETELPAVARRDTEHATVVFPAGTAGTPTVAILSYTEPAR